MAGLVIWGVRSPIHRRDGDHRQPAAREILDRRLADGAISVEEYERIHDAMPPTPTHP